MHSDRTRNVRVRAVMVMALAAGLAPTAFAQTTLEGVQFIDRAATGEITLGFFHGALAVLDYDRDGFMDLAVGDWPGAVSNRLFRNIPDPARPGRRKFTDVTLAAGLADTDAQGRFGGGVIAADYDNDGDPDLFFVGNTPTSSSSGLLYRNNGDGTFTNVSVPSGVRSNEKTDSAAWVDYDLDGRVDLVLTAGGSVARPARVYRNNGDGTFTDRTAIVPAINGGTVIYSHLWTDVDGDGDQDGVILTTGVAPSLLRNDVDASGNRFFTNAAAALGFTVLGPAPMGVAAGDFDGDGDRDLAITDAIVGTYYRNDGGVLTKFTPFETFFGWGVTWIDADNDGRLDMYQAGSYPRAANFDRVVRNLGNGQWSDISPALNGTQSQSQHAVQVDLDNDGRQDLVTVNPGVPGQFVSVYENNSPFVHHWLTLKIAGDGARTARDATGALVRLRAGGATQTVEIINGSSTTSTEDLRAHFGLGSATSAEWIEVVWPRRGSLTQRTERYAGPFAADQFLAITERCPTDFDGNGFVTGDDFDGYVQAFVEGAGSADFNADGFVSGDDFDAFVVAFAAGC